MTAENNGHGLARIRQLLAFHEGKASALRTTLELLTEAATEKKRGRPVATTVLAAALDLDAKRRTPTTKKKKGGMTHAKRQSRAQSAALLKVFTTKTPQTLDELRAAGIDPQGMRSLGSLQRFGYLKKTADGYVRTSKEYHP